MGLNNIVKLIIRLVIPKRIRSPIKGFLLYRYYQFIQYRYKRIARKLRKKEKIRVAFFLIHDSVWKYDGIYKLMEQDSRFEPIVVVCPYTMYGEENMLKEMEKAFKTFSEKGYKVVKTYNEVTKEWMEVRKEINPDIVFFTNPHNLTGSKYYITSYLDKLTCYVPYAFMAADRYREQVDQLFHNILWKAFYETTIHKKIAEQYATIKGTNVIVSGYPSSDIFFNKEYDPVDVWKIKDRKIKRIIWAPHHLMKELSQPSTFLKYYGLMLEIAKQYEDKIQIALKPHPVVKYKLYTYPEWGKERTDRYFEQWKQLNNGQLVEGFYDDLFLTSDALIHDCGSFITEYIYTKKPSLFMISNNEVMKGWNEYGEKALKVLYHGYSENDIYNFIDNIVIKNDDLMKDRRLNFLAEVLTPPNGETASKNIYDYLVRTLFK